MPGLVSYSFLDVLATIVGPGGAFSLGNGAGDAEGGISIELSEDKDTQVIGADGQPMHSLHAGQGGTVTVRVLKTSSTNFLLSTLYAFQSSSSALWGQNVIAIANIASGDQISCQYCAFKKQPANTWAKEWAFNAGIIYELLGAG